MNTYQVRFPVVTVAEDSPGDAVLRALETLARLVREGAETPYVNRIIPFDPARRIDWAAIHAYEEALDNDG